jgi:anhydro-N-acetylmuramic acid kinase
MLPNEKVLKIIGLMSGTSLDGLDLVFVHLWYEKNKWNYKIIFS